MESIWSKPTYPVVILFFGVLLICRAVGLSTYILLERHFDWLLLCSVPLMLLLGLVILSSKQGVSIDISANKIIRFKAVLFRRTEDIRKLNEYPYLTIFTKKYGKSAISAKGANTMSYTQTIYIVYFLNESHSRKLEIFRSGQLFQANKVARIIMDVTGSKLTKYSPPKVKKNASRVIFATNEL